MNYDKNKVTTTSLQNDRSLLVCVLHKYFFTLGNNIRHIRLRGCQRVTGSPGNGSPGKINDWTVISPTLQEKGGMDVPWLRCSHDARPSCPSSHLIHTFKKKTVLLQPTGEFQYQ